jgi:hypothetical protein
VNRNTNRISCCGVTCALLLCQASASAILVDLPDVGSKGYFLDLATGLKWMDVDNFWGLSYHQTEAALVGTGFRLATFADVQALAASLGHPAMPSAYAALTQVVGGTYAGGPASRYLSTAQALFRPEPWSRGIVLGHIANDSAFTSELWGWNYEAPGWFFHYQGHSKDSAYPRLGAWVVENYLPVPEVGGSAVMLGLGMAALLALRRKAGQVKQSPPPAGSFPPAKPGCQ